MIEVYIVTQLKIFLAQTSFPPTFTESVSIRVFANYAININANFTTGTDSSYPYYHHLRIKTFSLFEIISE